MEDEMDTFLSALGLVATVVLFAGLLATVTERLVEHIVKPAAQSLGVAGAVPYAAMLLGLAFSVAFGIDLFTPVAVAIGLEPLTPWAGLVLSGWLVGGGCNLICVVWPGKYNTDRPR
jgi:hypothetical protein